MTAVEPVGVPPRDPPLPRFARLALVFAALASAWLFARPVAQVAPRAESSAPIDFGLDAEALGAELFVTEGCAGCHSTVGSSTARGPSLADSIGLAEERLARPSYSGHASSAAGFLREAIADHCVDVVGDYACDHVPEYGLRLSTEQLDSLVAYLASRGGEEGR